MSAATAGGNPATAGGIPATFSWSVATPDGTVASGECEFLVVPTAGGELGVLAGHAALAACVVPGVLRVTASPKADSESASPKADSTSGGATRSVSVGPGVVDVRDNRVRLLVTRAAEGGFGAGGESAAAEDSSAPDDAAAHASPA